MLAHKMRLILVVVGIFAICNKNAYAEDPNLGGDSSEDGDMDGGDSMDGGDGMDGDGGMGEDENKDDEPERALRCKAIEEKEDDLKPNPDGMDIGGEGTDEPIRGMGEADYPLDKEEPGAETENMGDENRCAK
ncbi:hypothetical protein PV325_005498 [Microctonus aethiopoides]|uniref:Uncharacterized protein n=1 Tax=Microctonus aethiopoides TaxID=144406 RepID=A0AA39KUK5_9HYME|nr:hypothetical protein PV325_005498 [Microctonus aethiopoides]KAK0174191.1 hypothetical protein PV328_007300 [Microctonus aethiopoides]